MRPLPERIVRTLFAGLRGAVESLALLALGLVVGVVLMQAGLQWYASGTFRLFPPATPTSSRAAGVSIIRATPAEAAAIRSAVTSIRYRLPPRAVTFGVTIQPACPQCEGEYVPALNLIQLQRDLVDANGPLLRHAVAHEIGHYVDQHYLTDTQRREFMRLRHIPPNTSWLANDKAWQDRPVEDFAEVFAILNLTTIDAPPQTSYGPVRDPAAYQRLLASAGVRFDQSSSGPGWASVIVQEFAFFNEMSADSLTRLLFDAVIVFYILWGAWPEMRRTWRT